MTDETTSGEAQQPAMADVTGPTGASPAPMTDKRLAEALTTAGLDFWHGEKTGNVDARDGFEEMVFTFDRQMHADAIAASEPGAALLADAAVGAAIRRLDEMTPGAWYLMTQYQRLGYTVNRFEVTNPDEDAEPFAFARAETIEAAIADALGDER